MTRPALWKRALAVPAALSLALGGALLASTPAVAAPGAPVAITSPAAGSTVEARSVTVSGTGSNGATVALTGADSLISGQATVDDQGVWSVLVEFPETAAPEQSITARQVIDVDGQSTPTEATVTFLLPAADQTPPAEPAPGQPGPVEPGPVEPSPTEPAPPVVVQPLVVTSPVSGATLDSRAVDFTGTATAGSLVAVTVESVPLGGGTADANGDFTFPVEFPFVLEGEITVVVTATAPDGTAAAPVTLQLTLPALLDAPVITSPTDGQRIASNRVTVTGTGVAGEDLLLLALPTDVVEEILEQFTATEAEADGSEGIYLVTVGDDGRWSVTLELAPDDYVAEAIHVETNDQDEVVAFASLPSNLVEFTVVAPVAPGAGGGQLAATGGIADNALAGAAAALMVLTGAALFVLRRKRGLVG